MTAILLFLLAPALLLCALKLSLVERLWEIVLSALLIATVPAVMHRVAVRASLTGVESALRTPEALNAFAALLVLEAIVTLTLAASIMAAHSRFPGAPGGASEDAQQPLYGGAAAVAAVVLLAGYFLDHAIMAALGLLALAGLAAWPWLPLTRLPAVAGRLRPGSAAPYAAILITPAWALLSPAGIAAAAGLQMRLLATVTGVPLWRVSAGLAAGLFGGAAVAAFLLRYLAPNWRTRLDAVMLLGFILLMAAMFMPQLFSDTPPPSSVIRVNWPATAVFGCLTGLALLLTNLPRRSNSSAAAKTSGT